jgi:hypothetical protein
MNLILTLAALTGLAAWPSANAQTQKPTPPKSLRLYVLDCGTITVANGNSMGFKPGELVTEDRGPSLCILDVAGPRGAPPAR